MAYSTSQRYKEVIYSGNSQHRIRIWFDNVELEDADRYCEKLIRKPRIIPDDGAKRFSLDNFVSQEIELILHNVDANIIKDQVRISIGTLVDNDYEYVPIGIFNIQDEPVTDKDKITITLRDNAVLFDFGYNAKPLIDANDGVATKMQILKDICNQAGVICGVQEFANMNDELATYDNTITGRTYVAYLAEQSGNIATINRSGELIFVNIINKEVKNVSGENINIENATSDKLLYLKLYGNTSQEETPSVANPINVKTVRGNNTIVISNNSSSSNYNISFGNIELCKIGEHQDYIYYDEGIWYLHKEIGKYIVDENDVRINTNYTNVNYGIIPKQIDDILYNTYDRNLTCIASFAVNASGIRPWGLIDSIDKIMGDAVLDEYWIGFSKNSTLQDIKNQINNQLLYYVFKEPTEIQITDETLIEQLNGLLNAKLYYGDNNITTTTNNSLPTLELQYYVLKEGVKIPLSVVEKYEIGDKFKISRVVYEDAIRKFQYPNEIETSNDTLFINSANPFIDRQEQIDTIYEMANDIELDSLTTGKILGDPSIDPYDIIEIYGYYDENNQFVDDKETIVARTLGNHTSTYNGAIINEFDTQIGLEERTENVTLKGEASFRRFAKTNIDNINNNIEMLVVEQNETSERLSQTIQNVNSIQNLFQITGGNNLIKDSQLLLKDEGLWEYGAGSSYALFPSNDVYPSSSLHPIEYYFDEADYIGGYDATLIGKTVAIAKIGISNGKMTTTRQNITNLIIDSMYTLSFKITNDENTTSKIKLIGNGNVVYEQNFDEEVTMQEVVYSFVAQTSNYSLEIQTTSTTDGYVYIYDLMLNKGDVQTWEPASGELVSTVIKLSQLGIQVYSSGSEIATLMTSEGFDIRRFSNGTLYEIVTSFNKSGFISKKGILEELQINDFEYKTVKYRGYDTLVLYKKGG